MVQIVKRLKQKGKYLLREMTFPKTLSSFLSGYILNKKSRLMTANG